MDFTKSNRKKTVILVLMVCLMLVLFVHNQWGYRGNCVLCNSRPYHEPCVVSLATGDIIPLTVYDPDPFLAGELAEKQSDGYATLFRYPGVLGQRDTDTRKTSVTIQPCNANPLRRSFCHSCRKELSKYSQTGFVMADFQTSEYPVILPLENNSNIFLRCYEISISMEPTKSIYHISVQGTLE